MFSRVVNFVKRNGAKLATAPAVATAVAVTSTVASHAEGTNYTPQAVPTATTMDLSLLGNLWNYAQSMLQDVIAIISSQPLLVVMVIALPLIGIGVGLFKRIIN